MMDNSSIFGITNDYETQQSFTHTFSLSTHQNILKYIIHHLLIHTNLHSHPSNPHPSVMMSIHHISPSLIHHFRHSMTSTVTILRRLLKSVRVKLHLRS